ncbi:hypothetical protein GGQ59_002638 [Parvularcula dongshanensis]|uniref:Uncharacterized protein n=1 Tax=Parvularcula dongshanensis TaxID=1173995 RepID=A0A840I7D9_9PROT|nr:hypothetical protein [Parvularcula dongshanensis]
MKRRSMYGIGFVLFLAILAWGLLHMGALAA